MKHSTIEISDKLQVFSSTRPLVLIKKYQLHLIAITPKQGKHLIECLKNKI